MKEFYDSLWCHISSAYLSFIATTEQPQSVLDRMKDSDKWRQDKIIYAEKKKSIIETTEK